MTEKTKRLEWMKAFFPPTSKEEDGSNALLEVWRASMLQAATAQRTAFELYRQVTEGEGDERSLRSYQEELLHKVQEAMDPFFAIEEQTRQQVLKAQSAMFELCEDTLRGFVRFAEERSRSKPV